MLSEVASKILPESGAVVGISGEHALNDFPNML